MLRELHMPTLQCSILVFQSSVSVMVCKKLPGRGVRTLLRVRRGSMEIRRFVLRDTPIRHLTLMPYSIALRTIQMSGCPTATSSLLPLPASSPSPAAPRAGLSHEEIPLYGIQFHPEVTHTPFGSKILENFAVKIAKCQQNWTMEEFISKEIKRIQTIVGPDSHVIGAVSGGVDSTVAAKLMHEAIGNRFHAILVDNGVMSASRSWKL